MSNSDRGRNVVPQPSKMPSVVTLGPLTTLDLSFLSDEGREQLMKDYARGVLDVAKKAHELHVDVGALKAKLETFAQIAKDASKEWKLRDDFEYKRRYNRSHGNLDG
jgi:hypothetical protein